METNKIYNENCLATMENMPDCFIDLTITSPPYDNLRTYKGYSFPFEEIGKELFRVTKEGGILVWIVSDATLNGSESGTSFKQALYFISIGFNLHDTMIYRKTSKPLTHNRYEQEFEYMFILSKGKPKTFNPILVDCANNGKKNHPVQDRNKEGKMKEGKKRNPVLDKKIKGNIWAYSTGFRNSSLDKIAFKHPAIFPERLVRDHILSWTNEGHLVYDCFGGSGTTCKMAHLNNRKWVMSEISSDYCEIAKLRLSTYLNQHSLFSSSIV